ncbi:MAG: TonB-dependent receptor plug domain-containing protein, partial [Longimicrobiales bacterium]
MSTTRLRSKAVCSLWPALALAAIAVNVAAPLVAQQTGVITGTVTRTGTGQLLADVQISVGGTGIGMLTTGDGQFRLLDVPAGTHTISATLIGYGQEESEVEVTAGDAVTVDFELQTTAVQLDGIVVTGTGIAARRRELGNSIELITAEQIAASGAVNIDEVLRGRVPGMTVQGASGQVGAGSQILLRGLTSLNGRNRPLIYIDGIRMNDRGAYENDGAGNGRTGGQGATVLNSINPLDIERIEVIKGAAAATLYGTEASAGVIQIVTKRGISGQQRWTLSVEQGVSVPTHVGPDSDPTGLHLNDCTVGGPLRPEQTGPDPACPSSGSWLQNAHHQKYNLNVRGGTEDLDYFFGANWGNQQGIANVPTQYDPQESTDINVRGNFGITSFDNLEVRLNSSFTRRDISWIEDGDNNNGFTKNVIKLDVGDTPEDVDSLVFQSDIDQTIDHMTIGMNLRFTPNASFRHRLN